MAYKHFEAIEKHAGLLAIGIAIMVSLGGLAEITPLFVEAHKLEAPPGVHPYDPLRLAGKDVYVREGCYLCHSQMIRAPNRSTTGRSSGAPSAPARIWPVSAASTPTTGSACT